MKLKRLSALMLTGVMALSVVACGGNKSTDDTQSASKKDDGVSSATQILILTRTARI